MNIIIDGNYLLYRNVFSLVREKLLYGYLYESLDKSLKAYSTRFPFDNVYLVSDSISNWRKGLYSDYKANRKKSTDIDWEFVHTIYEEWKENLPDRVEVFEAPMIEGDDWIYYLTRKHNKLEESMLIISNDGDLKQLLTTGEKWINLMVNENTNHNYIFCPENYQTWLAKANDSISLPDLFDQRVNSDLELYNFIKKLISKRQVQLVNRSKSLLEKIISGDRSDNIKSVWGKLDSKGTFRGIGEKGAEKLYNQYYEYFGDPNFDSECFDRVADLIIEAKKLNSTEYDKVRENINFNNKLVNLNKIPKNIIKIIEKKAK